MSESFCFIHQTLVLFPPYYMGLSENSGFSPQIIHFFMGFSIVFTIRLGYISLFLGSNTHIHPPKNHQKSPETWIHGAPKLPRSREKSRTDARLQYKAQVTNAVRSAVGTAQLDPIGI